MTLERPIAAALGAIQAASFASVQLRARQIVVGSHAVASAKPNEVVSALLCRMDSISPRGLSRDSIASCLIVLRRFQVHNWFRSPLAGEGHLELHTEQLAQTISCPTPVDSFHLSPASTLQNIPTPCSPKTLRSSSSQTRRSSFTSTGESLLEDGLHWVQEDHTAASPAEKYAVGQLIDWLNGVPISASDSDGEDLDESTRSYLASYKDNFARKSASQASWRTLAY